MSEYSSIPEKIQWHEGMLLAPQHFQQMSDRFEETLSYQLRAGNPYHWGIHRLAYDKAALIEGRIIITELQAVMPDGLIVGFSEDRGGPLEMDLTAHMEIIREKGLMIYAAVPARKATDSGSVRGELARYESVEGFAVPDVNTGDSEVSIPRLRPVIRLLSGEKPSSKYTWFPLLFIGYRNEACHAEGYVPPMLKVSLDSSLGRLCSSVAQKIREKAVVLSEKINSPLIGVYPTIQAETSMVIQNLVSGLPRFETMLGTGKEQPYRLYTELCAIAGRVALISKSMVPPLMPVYDHCNLMAIFDKVRGYIFKTISENITESHTAIPFNYARGVFSLRIVKKWHEAKLIVGARLKPGFTEQDLDGWFGSALVASRSKIEGIKSRRILGARRMRLKEKGEIIPPRGTILYEINTSADSILPDEVLYVTAPVSRGKDAMPAELRLYVKTE